jgi:hypothetical protein
LHKINNQEEETNTVTVTVLNFMLQAVIESGEVF